MLIKRVTLVSLVGPGAVYPKDPQFSYSVYLLSHTSAMGPPYEAFVITILLTSCNVYKTEFFRIITGTSYENADLPSLLKQLGLLNIRKLINLDLCVLMLKVNEGLTPRPMCDMFQRADAVHQYGTRSATQDNFYSIKTNEQITNSAISYRGPELWNEIPRSIRDSGSLYIFKKRFREFLASFDTDTFLF